MSYAAVSTVDPTLTAYSSSDSTASSTTDTLDAPTPAALHGVEGAIGDSGSSGLIAPAAAPAPAQSSFLSLLPSSFGMNVGQSDAASASGVLGLDNPEVQGFISSIRSRRWVATLRPVPSFAGAASFSKPRTTAEAMARIEANLPHFLTNYTVLCLIVAAITILSRPWLLLVGAILGVAWYFATKQDVVQVGQYSLQGRAKMSVLTGATAVILFITAGTTLFFLLGICATIVLAHAMLHNLPAIDESDSEMNEFSSPA